MRGLVNTLVAAVILFWAPVALWVFVDAGLAFTWWAGVATGLVGWASGAVINRREGKQ